MPRAASICLRHGCTSKTTRDGRCAAHQLPRRSWDRTSPRNGSRPADAASLRSRALARDGFACQACGSRSDLEVDHTVPISRGGTWELANLLTLCKPCHKRKTYYGDRAVKERR